MTLLRFLANKIRGKSDKTRANQTVEQVLPPDYRDLRDRGSVLPPDEHDPRKSALPPDYHNPEKSALPPDHHDPEKSALAPDKANHPETVGLPPEGEAPDQQEAER